MRDDPLSRRRTAALAASGLGLIAVCYGLARFAYGLFVPSFRGEFDLDAATAGAIASASYLAYCAGIVVATALSPRLGARAVAVLAGALAAAGTAAVAAAPDAVWLATGVALAGASTGVASPPLAQAIARTVASDRRDRVQTIVNSGTGLGVLVSGPVALIAAENWRWAWAAFAILSAAAALAASLAVPAARERSPRQGRGRRLPPGAVRLVAAAAVMGLATAAVWTFGQDHLRTAGSQSTGAATWAWIVLGACGLAGAAAGDTVTRLGIATSWRVMVVVAAGGTATLALWPGSFPLALVASGVFGAVYIALTGVLLVWSTRVLPDRPSTGVGIVFLALAVGQAVGAPALGAIGDAWGLPSAFLTAAAIGLGGLVIVPRAEEGSGAAAS